VSLDGRGVVVVGGPSAYGRAVAVAAAARGATVVYSVLPGREVQAAVVAGTAESRMTTVTADPSREDEVERLFGIAVDRLPRIDVVVHAAPAPPPRGLVDTSLAEWEHDVASALRGAFFVSRLAVEEFLAHGAGGRLLHIAPLVLPGEPGQALAAAALQALLSLMRSTAKEYGPRRVVCNAVVPVAGGPRTPPGTAHGDAVSEAILFLASEEASYLNGDALRVAATVP
jgi:NAD(P)-dependent dehydrogenase (short-subunit alcohol dehydrogenase family)